MMDEIVKALAMLDLKPSLPIEYRVYYDLDSGDVIEYTNDIRPGDYIIVDRETWAANRFDRKVKDGRLISPLLLQAKLVPATDGRPCDPFDITVIVDEQRPNIKWKMRTYEN